MMNLKQGIIELYRKVATSTPPDVEAALRRASDSEEAGSVAKKELGALLQNIRVSRVETKPTCLDSGVPVFYVGAPHGSIRHSEIRKAITEGTRAATESIPLASNSVDTITGQNTGDNTGLGFPVIVIEETEGANLTVELMLLGSSSENLGRLYSLPEAALGAERGLEGVRLCVLDAVAKAGGRGCPPYIIGVGVGGTREQVTRLSKAQLRRKLTEENPVAELGALERRLYEEINKTGIGTGGHGGKVTALGVKLGALHRHPDSYFVDVSFLCWNTRRGKLIW